MNLGKTLKLDLAFAMVFIWAMIVMISSLPVMWLWNACLVPAVDGVNEIGWLQAMGIMLLIQGLTKTSVSFNT
jgi:hypothetical protein